MHEKVKHFSRDHSLESNDSEGNDKSPSPFWLTNFRRIMTILNDESIKMQFFNM